MAKILVVGARGTVGKPLVDRLRAQGHTVQAAVRQPQAAGEHGVDLLQGEGLDAAAQGMEAAFLMSPPGHVAQDQLLGLQLAAVQRAGVGKVVLMTAMGADADPGSPFRRAELALERSGLAWNVIRPNWFMQNFNSYWLSGIREQGQILLPTGQAKGSFIDARDIADSAAALLSGREHEGQAFNLTGPDALDHDEVAALLSRETGRRIGYTDVPPETLRAGLLAAGLGADYAELLLTILGFFKAGYAAPVSDAVQRLTGQAPRRFADYAKDYRSAWL